jgi:hypothetical protein
MTLRYKLSTCYFSIVLFFLQHPFYTTMTIPTTTPPKAIPTEARDFISHPSLVAALGDWLEPPDPPDPPAPPDPEGEDEVGADREEVGDGVKTPPAGS